MTALTVIAFIVAPLGALWCGLMLTRPWRRTPPIARSAPRQRPVMIGLWWALTEPDRQIAAQRWPWDSTDDLPSEWGGPPPSGGVPVPGRGAPRPTDAPTGQKGGPRNP